MDGRKPLNRGLVVMNSRWINIRGVRAQGTASAVDLINCQDVIVDDVQAKGATTAVYADGVINGSFSNILVEAGKMPDLSEELAAELRAAIEAKASLKDVQQTFGPELVHSGWDLDVLLSRFGNASSVLSLVLAAAQMALGGR